MSQQLDLFSIPSLEPAPATNNSDGDILIWDLETQNSIKEAGGYDKLHRLKISVGVAYSVNENRYIRYLESEIPELIQRIKKARLQVGFNLIGFDLPVLAGYSTGNELKNVPVCDMLAIIHQKLGFRISLANLAETTLGHGKSADGLQAIEWFKQGKLDLILEYCQQDVKVTKELWEFGKKNGFVYYMPKGSYEKRKLEISW